MTFLLKKIMQFAVLFLTFARGVCVYLNYSLYAEQQEASKEPRKAGATATEIRLAWAGDIVCHGGLNAEAFDGTEYDYTT